MSEDVKFTCGECGKEIEPDPDTMVEWEIGPVYVREEDVECGVSVEKLAEMPEYDLKALGITPEQRDALMRGEAIKFGGCVCHDCMKDMEEGSEE